MVDMNLQFLNFIINISHKVIPFLCQQILYSTIVFVVIWLVTVALKNKSPRWHYALWFLVLIRLILPPDFSHNLSGRNLIVNLPVYQHISNWFDFLKPNQNSNALVLGVDSGFSIQDNSTNANQDLTIQTGDNFYGNLLIASLFLIWVSGAFIFLIIYLKKLFSFYSIIKEAIPVKNRDVLKIVREWSTFFRLRREIKIVYSDKYLSPFTTGILKPIIYLPQKILEIKNKEHLKSVIAHEISHIKRYDNLWIKIQSILQIIYFFNPIVWFVNSKISLSRECICDSLVLSKKKISAQNYGTGIMTVLKLNLFGANEINVLPGFGSQRKKLIYRIKNLTGEKIMGKYQALIIYGVLILLGIFVLPMAGSVVKKANQNSNEALIADELNQPKAEEIEFVLPIKYGRKTAGFGNMKHPYTKKVVFHNGIDIAATKGTEVYSSADGEIVKAETEYKKNKGQGKHILIRHKDGFSTFYSHLDEVLVEKGQKVKAGELIAKVGTTGRSTGSHLHFEIRLKNKPHNPKKYVDFKKLIVKIEEIEKIE